MVFSGIVFLGLFLPAVLILYFGLPFRRWRNYVLLAASLLFYAWGEPLWVLAMIFTSAVDFASGRWISRLEGSKYRRLPLILSIVLDLGILMIFKYSGFLSREVFSWTGILLPAWNRPMPIGISFYTFQSLSYTLDVYRGQTKVQKNFFYYLMYVSMFPQLVAGPIVRYADIAAQIENRQESEAGFYQGALRFCVGLGKKVILANNAGKAAAAWLTPAMTSGIEIPVLNAWLGAAFYTFQIYYDFAGYSDMAIGLGKIFGFDYKENFNYPYIARSVTDFWRRWHISLSSFFRDYVYIPLGGNRRALYRNIFVVWLLTGLWHGASWNFILWGLYYGVLLILEKTLWGKYLERSKWLGHMLTVLLFVYGWVIFYCTDLEFLLTVSRSLIGFGGRWLDLTGKTWFLSNIWILPVYLIGATPYPKRLAERIFQTERARDLAGSVFVLVVFTVSVILLIGQTYNPFLYFRF